MGVLFGRSPAGKQLLATWALIVVPSGMSLRGPDMSLEMRLSTVSVKQRVQRLVEATNSGVLGLAAAVLTFAAAFFFAFPVAGLVAAGDFDLEF